ncbi:Vacuolar protein sorting-associated protein 13D [Gryllus bimaculatus]|nr:Vacuolar protein sorting-associated protein 13D [Gryllus bimaculatus]
MLEGLVAWVLNNYLGKYVENLNTDQLSIALLQGEVELENLPLKKGALRHFGIPVEIRAGFVGKIKLQIPVRQLRSAPWVIIIEQLHVVTGPYRLSEWDEEVEELAAQDYKLSILDEVEARWRAKTDNPQESNYYASSYSSWMSYGTGLVANIVENLQLKIKDVHMRFEDDETTPGQAFALGVMIESLTAQSCDDKWMPRFTNWDSGNMSFKLMELNTLAVYFDSLSSDQLLGGLSLGDLAVAMSKCAVQKHHFILAPVSAQAHVKRNRSEQPLRSRTQPRIVCDLHLEEVPLTLIDWQYGLMVSCLKGLRRIERARRYRKWRPDHTVAEDPRAWWMYVIISRFPHWKEREQSESERWATALQRAHDNVAYVKMYVRLLANPTAALPPDSKTLKDTMELQRDLDELKTLRECAMWQMRQNTPVPADVPMVPTPNGAEATLPADGGGSSAGRGVLLQWFPLWWGWYSTPQAGPTQTTVNATASVDPSGTAPPELEEELLDALADTVENNTLLRRDTVFGQFNFTLKKGAFNLCTSKGDYRSESVPVIELQFESMQLGLESRPRTGSHKFHITLGAMFLVDHYTEDSEFRVLVRPENRRQFQSALGRGTGRPFPPGLAKLLTSTGRTPQPDEPLFTLTYEYRPFSSNIDYRLHITSQSLDVVYNPSAIKWLTDFFTRPHQKPDAQLRQAARHRYEAMKQKTKDELMKNWEQILAGDLQMDRKIWDIKLDISAPQIMLLENFCDKNALIVVVDFGKFYFSNQSEMPGVQKGVSQQADSDDEDNFQTPCSTPPGSEASEPESSMTIPTVNVTSSQKTEEIFTNNFSEAQLHQKLYDRYTMELGDMQILVGRVRDNWKYAHLKGTSTLHVLDRFNISLTIERRIVFMNDPHFPSLRLTGNLPKLVVHVNEQKVDALRTMVAIVSGKGLPSPFRSQSIPCEEETVPPPEQDISVNLDMQEPAGRESARLVMLQFSVEQLALEVQSRGRSIAELQVSGVRAAYTRRTYDTILQLSVHSLLLVDALQTFGPDFELLVASHKHVGMDSVSGSLRDSEPTSPTSPGSPDPTNPRTAKATSPIALTQALSNLQTDSPAWHRAVSPTFPMPVSPPGPTSPPPSSFSFAGHSQYLNSSEVLDAEALITIEIWLVSPQSPDSDGEALQTASIQFNNLDIIANQETIVELMGFARRVFPSLKPSSKRPVIPSALNIQGPTCSSNSDTPARMASPRSEVESGAEQPTVPPTRTELTFDFHRLNVLLLRAVYKDGTIIGRKIATATMSEAMVQATLGTELTVQGSLGGLQVLDQTPEGQRHQRILSLGKDPFMHRTLDLVSCLNAEIYSMGQTVTLQDEVRAFSFSVHRTLDSAPQDCADIKVRMASVWYTHSPRLITELQSCASEFKQYLTNLARSIRSAATEMAIGLVHARAEALAQSLYMNSRLSSSFYGGSASEVSSPRRRRRSSVSQSTEMLETIGSTRGTTPHTPFSPSDDELIESFIDFRLDVVLDSPVVVLPRHPSSPQVFVAHLGKISVRNCIERDDESPTENTGISLEQELWGMGRREQYNIEIRDMNLYSLDTEHRLAHETSHSLHPSLEVPLMRPEKLYSCAEDGKPILHNTIIKLHVDRDVGRSFMRQSDSLPTLLLGQDAGTEFHKLEQQDLLHVSGRVETPLKVSLSRQQYEQLLDTLESLMIREASDDNSMQETRHLSNIEEEETDFHIGVSTLKMDPTVRAKMLNIPTVINRQKADTKHTLSLKVLFELPIFTVELKGDLGSGEKGLVDISFRDFSVQYEKCDEEETNIQMSLRSLLMEDLSFDPESKHRCIVVSTAVSEPELDAASKRALFVSKSCPNLASHIPVFDIRASLPDRLEADPAFKAFTSTNKTSAARPSQRVKSVAYPCTPPPSPRVGGSPVGMHRHDNLVHINVLIMMDPTTNTVRRNVTIDFNSLDIIVNMESWAVVLDFFGVGSSQSQPSEDKTDAPQPSSADTQASNQEVHKLIRSEVYIDVRSFTLVLNRLNYEVARANISNLTTSVRSNSCETIIEGRIGSMSLLDLSPHGQLYCERFVTSGSEALNFHMIRYLKDDPTLQRECDSRLSLEMSSVIYVHTRRFVAELQAFFYRFSQLQSVVASIRAAASGSKVQEHQKRSSRMLLELHAGSPVILLPLSSRSTDVLIADLGKLSISNCFKMSNAEGTFGHKRRQSGRVDTSAQKDSYSPNEPPPPCLVDVMQIDLDNMDLYSGIRQPQNTSPLNSPEKNALNFSTFIVKRKGAPLLKEKCHLRLQVERNLESLTTHQVPDLFVNGKLSALHGALDLSQYKLIRGLLSYNLGEVTPDLDADLSSRSSSSSHPQVTANEPVWPLTSIYLDLEDVTVKLQLCHGNSETPESSLAGVNFIKSRLVIETFSDGSRDIDLESREILVTDTRFQAEPANKRSNVFTNILQPINMAAKKDDVQAEIHHRWRNQGFSKFAVLLKDMRLMVILDWWEAVRNFIMDNSDNAELTSEPTPRMSPPSVTPKSLALVSTVGIVTKCPPVVDVEKAAFELKLNITSSEVVLVEDTSQWDTNAVILKSNSVIMYRPQLPDKPLSCDLNHCELFSCILGMEDETALSIVDPAQICIEVARRPSTSRGIADVMTSAADRVLEVHSKDLTVRLSYHDMCMFTRILRSLPNQTLWARSQSVEQDLQPANIRSQVNKLVALGFYPDDCVAALNQCNGLDDAALWLTQNAVPVDTSTRQAVVSPGDSPLSFESISVDMACVRVVVIDDCRDADVPLLELLLARLQVQQCVGGQGTATCQLSCDYFNRTLSGWEPFIEPWGCEVIWEHLPPTSPISQKNKLQISVASEDLLNVNVTSTFVDLYRIVKDNWLQDYNSVTSRDRCEVGPVKHMGSPPGYRRRLPFVPYAVRNNTGSPLWFTTHITTVDTLSGGLSAVLEVDETWVFVDVDAVVPFTFEGRGKVRHRNTHKQNIHQLAVKVEGWNPVTPVSVDKVGVYFRQARPENYHSYIDLPQARLVFEVTLDGSAKKLVTVRSALMLCNRLQESVEVKLENPSIHTKGKYCPTIKTMHVASGEVLPVPLTHVHALLWVRPLDRTHPGGQWYQFCSKPLDWAQVTKPGDLAEETRLCHSNRDHCYRFCVAIRRENYPTERIPGVATHNIWVQPAHSITLLSPVTVTNLLPHELHFSLKDSVTEDRIRPGNSVTLQQVDLEKSLELMFWLENYPGPGTLVVPPSAGHLKTRIRLQDPQSRRLLLQAAVFARRGGGLSICISAPFWIINKTSLPLVFRQEGVPNDTAGQGEEHEVARMVAPLLFSFADHEASPSVMTRVGNGVHPDGMPQWCQNFFLHNGVQVRRLRVALRDGRPDLVYLIGISVRAGRGRYRHTSVVTLTPRFQLHNRSSFMLQFAQRCFATTLNDPGAKATYLTAVPDCCLAFHWPRLDKDQLLCVRLLDVQNCLWSGGFLIESNSSMHINIRDNMGQMYFLHVEVVLQEAMYFIVFTDADTMPSPLRIDNLAAVPLTFHQSCVTTESLQTTVRPYSSVPYSLDEPTQPALITLHAPGGAAAEYDLKQMGEGRGLTYENFIYIALTGTFGKGNGSCDTARMDPLDVQSQQLVLEVPHGSTRVVLARKEQGKRSQLWRMTGDGHLQHEGSSPPRDPRARIPTHSDYSLVLDIAGPAPQPSHYVNLELRRPDRRRTSTQTWRFTDDGRLCCAHNNMCVQAKDGFFGLHQGSDAVLGPPQPQHHQLTLLGVPLEQAVSRQRLRPGSGFLSVRVLTDGPTRVLQITDLKEGSPSPTALALTQSVIEDRQWPLPMIARPITLHTPPAEVGELEVNLKLPAGVGVSLVSRRPAEELLFAHLAGIEMEMLRAAGQHTLSLRVQDIQVDNQLYEAQCPVVVHVSPSNKRGEEEIHAQMPALELSAEKLPSPSLNAQIYKHLIMKVKNLSVNIEERLLLKLFAFAGYGNNEIAGEIPEENDIETQRIVMEAASVNATRYYFGNLRLEPSQVRLSVITTTKLPSQLQSIKKKLGLTLIKFEDAAVDLKPFLRVHPFESSQFLLHSIIKHFKDELMWQAAIILGSVDFLGNPLGLMNDVSEGMSGLIFEGNVSALLKNVTHGLSNSAAKVTESLSDGLGRVIMDEQHEETRQRIRGAHNMTSGDHIIAGFKGLGFGLLGGFTSVFRQTYEGATTEGMQGFISGLGKGLVGTVTKPVVGVLDLASETASAVRDSSRSSHRLVRRRFRTPRCVTGPSGLLPVYDKQQSEGQELLYSLNERNYSEVLVWYDCLLSGPDGLRVLVSSERVLVFTGSPSGGVSTVLQTPLGELAQCSLVSQQSPGDSSVAPYIELCNQDAGRRPRVRCDDIEIAKRVVHYINYAKSMFEERRHTVIQVADNILED